MSESWSLWADLGSIYTTRGLSRSLTTSLRGLVIGGFSRSHGRLSVHWISVQNSGILLAPSIHVTMAIDLLWSGQQRPRVFTPFSLIMVGINVRPGHLKERSFHTLGLQRPTSSLTSKKTVNTFPLQRWRRPQKPSSNAAPTITSSSSKSNVFTL